MGSKKKYRDGGYDETGHGRGNDRLEEKRRRFADEDRGRSRGGLKPSTIIAIGGIALAVVIVMVLTLGGVGGGTANAQVVQQTSTSAATVEGGKISIPLAEVTAKKIVYWDYKKPDGKTVPLMAFVTPSGAIKLAVRICEPCNGFSFRIEGNQIVCNVCGTRWNLEDLKGVSGGCQGYPPDVLQSTTSDGKISVDEAKVLAWKARI